MAGDMAALIGRNIATARRAKGITTQRELAEELRKLDPQRATANTTVSEWERGVRSPSEPNLKLLSQALEQPVDWFLRDHGKSETPDLSQSNGNSNGSTDDERLRRIEEQVDEIHDLLISRTTRSQSTDQAIAALAEILSELVAEASSPSDPADGELESPGEAGRPPGQ